VIPRLRSLFRWEHQLQSTEETLLILKTTAEALPQLTKEVREQHSYEIPEVIALPIIGGSAEYLAWLASEVQPHTGSGNS
jgi:periplasmic divalent cation tolerance protein